jgi:putative membrane protein
MMVLANMGHFGPGMDPRAHLFWPWGGLLLWMLLLGLVAFIAIMLLRRTGGSAASGPPPGTTPAGEAGSPLEVAKMRYAKGELTKEEYQALKADLE